MAMVGHLSPAQPGAWVCRSAPREESLGDRAEPLIKRNDPHGAARLPLLAERPDLDIERPGGARLMRDVPDLRRDVARLDEKVVGRIRAHLAGPGDIDHGVDDDVSDVDALRSELARDRFGQHALSGLARRKAGKIRLAA